MLDNFKDILLSYEEEYKNFSESEILHDEFQSVGKFNPRTILINERIKVSDTFTHYIIERCKPSEVTPLRRLVEEYEKNVAIIKDNELSGEEYFDVRNMTVVLDVLFGIDVTYSSNLYMLIQEGKMDKVSNYLERYMTYDLSFESVMSVIKGYEKKL